MNCYTELTDQALFDLIKSGNDTAFKEIYDRYFDLLYIHAYRRLQDREEAQDVVQEIFTNLWSKRNNIFLKSSLLAYLYTSVRNRIFNIFLHKQIESTYIQSLQQFINSEICETDHLLRENDLTAAIEKEVVSLPSKMQEIFKLSRKNYLTHKEIAAELNLSEQTVKKQVNNALRVLRTKFDQF